MLFEMFEEILTLDTINTAFNDDEHAKYENCIAELTEKQDNIISGEEVVETIAVDEWKESVDQHFAFDPTQNVKSKIENYWCQFFVNNDLCELTRHGRTR